MKIKVSNAQGKTMNLWADGMALKLDGDTNGEPLFVEAEFWEGSPVQIVLKNGTATAAGGKKLEAQAIPVKAITMRSKRTTVVNSFSYKRGEKIIHVRRYERSLGLRGARAAQH